MSKNASIEVGKLILLDSNGQKTTTFMTIKQNRELTIGRDRTKCHWRIDDLQLSRSHVRFHTVKIPSRQTQLQSAGPHQLVFVEDLSRNGVYLNHRLLRKKSAMSLICHGDVLRLTAQTSLTFEETDQDSSSWFNLRQEHELKAMSKDYNIFDKLVSETNNRRTFMAIKESTQGQLACTIIPLNHDKAFASIGKPRIKKVESGDDPSVDKASEDQHETTFISHIEALQLVLPLDHPNIASPEKVYATTNSLYVFHELYAGETLVEYMKRRNNKLLETEAAIILHQIGAAVKYLHAHEIVHRNLKPENIILVSLAYGTRVLLTNFENARHLPLSGINETKVKQQYTNDLVSIDAISIAMLTGDINAWQRIGPNSSIPFSKELFFNALRCQSISEDAINFIFTLAPGKNAASSTAETAYDHKWFTNEPMVNILNQLKQRLNKIHAYYRPPVSHPIELLPGHSCDESGYNISRNLRQKSVNAGRARKSHDIPVTPHYRPFYRDLYQKSGIWPERVKGYKTSDELKSAMSQWSSDSETSSASQDENFERLKSTKSKKRRKVSKGLSTTPANISNQTVKPSPTLASCNNKVSKASHRRSASLQRIRRPGESSQVLPIRPALVRSSSFIHVNNPKEDETTDSRNDNSSMLPPSRSQLSTLAASDYSPQLANTSRPRKRRSSSIYDIDEDEDEELVSSVSTSNSSQARDEVLQEALREISHIGISQE